MKKTQSKKRKGGVIIFFVVVAVGVVLGYGIFYATKKVSDDAPLIVTDGSMRAADGSDLPGEALDELAIGLDSGRTDEERQADAYEGSGAEQEVAREISGEDKKKLEDSVGEGGYVNRAYGFALVPPEGWHADPINSDIGQFISFTNFDSEKIDTRPEDAGLIFEVVVQGNTKNQSLEEWVEEGHGYMKLLKSDEITIGEHKAFKEEVDYQGKMSIVTIVRGEDVFSFSLMGKGYDENKGIFDKIIESLTVL